MAFWSHGYMRARRDIRIAANPLNCFLLPVSSHLVRVSCYMSGCQLSALAKLDIFPLREVEKTESFSPSQGRPRDV
ncbi:hypothetical protein AFLA_005147 [Aspergillus flavus NRRL3357]|nr:hypothetical protein AFLA_005147 [Aspergillus flavus NRRL3357]